MQFYIVIISSEFGDAVMFEQSVTNQKRERIGWGIIIGAGSMLVEGILTDTIDGRMWAKKGLHQIRN